MSETVLPASELEASAAITVTKLVAEDVQAMWELMQKNQSSLQAAEIYIPIDTEDVLDKIKFPFPEGRQDLVVKLDGTLIGGVDVIPQKPKQAEINYWIDGDFRGKGYGKVALQEAVDYSFNQLGINTLRAWVKQDNIASQKTLESSGFIHEDTNQATGSYGYTLKNV